MSYNITFTCKHCRQTVCVKSASKTRVYCSNKCQVLDRQSELLETWLTTGKVAHAGSHQSHYIKRYISEQQNNKCSICAMSQEWNQMPINFILDHIDGNSDNNTRDNLRLICPNCDSQLPTFKSRNRGKGRHWRKLRYNNGQSF